MGRRQTTANPGTDHDVGHTGDGEGHAGAREGSTAGCSGYYCRGCAGLLLGQWYCARDDIVSVASALQIMSLCCMVHGETCSCLDILAAHMIIHEQVLVPAAWTGC